MLRNRDSRWRRLAVAVSGTAAAALVAGCGSTSASSGGGSTEVDRNASLRIAYPVIQSLNPLQAPEPAQMLISTWPVYDRLIQVSASATYEPMLATKWEYSADGKELTLSLRDDVTFSDGTKFDAEVVKANLESTMAAKGTAAQANLADLAGVEVVDPTTVKLELAKPTTTVMSGLSSTLGGIMISPKSLGSKDLGSKPVGTGAYVIDSFQPGQKVTYKRRTDKGGIWDERTGKPAVVEVTTMGSTDAMTNALRGGQADMIVWSSDAAPFKNDIESGKLKQTVMSGVLNMVGVNFNLKAKPYDDPAVRKAFNYAIDREAIVKAFMPDTEPRVQPWPQGLTGADEAREKSFSFDPAKAKQLLKEAGYSGRINGGEMLVAQAGAIPAAAEAIQANLAEVGIDIVLRNLDSFTLVTEWAKGKAPMELMYMSLPSIEPYSWVHRLFLNPVWSPGGADPEIARMSNGLDDPSLSEAEQIAGLGRIVDSAIASARYAPMWQGVGGFISTTKVKDLDDLASVNGGVADLRNTYLTK